MNETKGERVIISVDIGNRKDGSKDASKTLSKSRGEKLRRCMVTTVSVIV